MATHIRNEMSIVEVADICDAIVAGLSMDEATMSLSTAWEALRDKADSLLAKQRDLDRRFRRARVRIQVCDSRWDAEVAAFGRAVVDASGGRRDVTPYTRFFSKVTPSDVQNYGIERELGYASGWLTELERDPSEALAQTWSPRLSAVTNALRAAVEERAGAEDTQQNLYRSATLLREEINRDLDILEGDLKKLFPRDNKRVLSYLSPTRPATNTRSQDDSGPTQP